MAFVIILNDNQESIQVDQSYSQDGQYETSQEDGENSSFIDKSDIQNASLASGLNDFESDSEVFFQIKQNSDSIQELLNNAESENLLSNEQVKSELFIKLYALCPQFQDLNNTPNSRYKLWAFQKANEYCAIEDEEKNYFESIIGDADLPHFPIGDAIRDDVNSGFIDEAIQALIGKIVSSKYLDEMSSSAALIAEIQTSNIDNYADTIFFDSSGQDLYLAAVSAANIYYCTISGGCDRSHPDMFFFCAEHGCEPFVTDMEQAIRRVNSIRVNELIDQYLSMIWAARSKER